MKGMAPPHQHRHSCLKCCQFIRAEQKYEGKYKLRNVRNLSNAPQYMIDVLIYMWMVRLEFRIKWKYIR